MRKIRDVLRLSAAGMSKRQIAASLGVRATAAGECIRRARRAGLAWPLPEELSDEALECRLFPPLTVAAGVAPSLFRQREGDCFSEDHAVFADRADRLRDANGQALAYIYFEDEPAIRSQAAHPGRGPTDRGQYRQAAGTPAPWVMRGCCRFALFMVSLSPDPSVPGRGFFLSIAGACRRKILLTRFGLQ